MEMGMSEKQRAFLTDRLRAKWGEKKKRAASAGQVSLIIWDQGIRLKKKTNKIKKFGLVNVEETWRVKKRTHIN